jgi:hypothetical protein
VHRPRRAPGHAAQLVGRRRLQARARALRRRRRRVREGQGARHPRRGGRPAAEPQGRLHRVPGQGRPTVPRARLHAPPDRGPAHERIRRLRAPRRQRGARGGGLRVRDGELVRPRGGVGVLPHRGRRRGALADAGGREGRQPPVRLHERRREPRRERRADGRRRGPSRRDDLHLGHPDDVRRVHARRPVPVPRQGDPRRASPCRLRGPPGGGRALRRRPSREAEDLALRRARDRVPPGGAEGVPVRREPRGEALGADLAPEPEPAPRPAARRGPSPLPGSRVGDRRVAGGVDRHEPLQPGEHRDARVADLEQGPPRPEGGDAAPPRGDRRGRSRADRVHHGPPARRAEDGTLARGPSS